MARCKRQAEKSKTRKGDALKKVGLEKFFDVLVKHGWGDVANLSRLTDEHKEEMELGRGSLLRLQALAQNQ